MKALLFDNELRLTDRPAPQPAADEALVRILFTGICNTDLEIIKGYMGFHGVPGHEFVGVVESAPDAEWIGKRVVGEINIWCGECLWCRAGLETHCPNRIVLGIKGRDGAFAEKIRLPAKNLHLVPDGLSDEKAVFAEPVAACFEILQQVEITGGDRIAVVGDGKLGLLAAQVLRTASPRVTVIGKHDEKLALARDRFSVKAVREPELGDELFDIVVECSGSPSGLELATRIIRPLGTIVLKSAYHERPSVNTSLWVVNEIKVVGSRCGPFPPALDALENGAVDPTPLIQEIFPFERALEAFDAARSSGALKILLDFSRATR